MILFNTLILRFKYYKYETLNTIKCQIDQYFSFILNFIGGFFGYSKCVMEFPFFEFIKLISFRLREEFALTGFWLMNNYILKFYDFSLYLLIQCE